MLLIQMDGTPTAPAAPASTPKTLRRVMGTLGSRQAGRNERHGPLYGVRRLNFEPAAKGSPRASHLGPQKHNNVMYLHLDRRALCPSFSLTFALSGRLTRALSRKDVLFDPPPGPRDRRDRKSTRL